MMKGEPGDARMAPQPTLKKGANLLAEDEKVRAFEVDPAPLKNSREIVRRGGVKQPRAFEKRSAPLT